MATGDILINFRTPETPTLRNERGHFTSEGVRDLRNRNKLLATNMLGLVGRRMANEIAFGGRQEASTGRLLAVTVSGKNAYYDNWNVGVGRLDYLNRSTAKYWRTFEEGSLRVWRRPFIGTQLVPIYNRKGPSPGGTNLRTARPGLTFKNQSGRDGFFVVKKEIAPAHIYRQVFEQYDLATIGLQNVRAFLAKVYETPVKTFQPKTRAHYTPRS